MTDDEAREDRHHLADATHVVHGERGSGSARQEAYAVYVAVLLAFTYGFTIARGIFVTSDARWVRAGLERPLTWGLAAAAALGVAVLVRRSGRERGPVTPPLPWVDHVVVSAIDRGRALLQWWAGALVGGVTTGALLGGILGGGLFASGVGGPAWLALSALGAAVGLIWAWAWLTGQWASAPQNHGIGPLRGRTALRELPIDVVRAHSSRAGRLHGAVLAGDLRAARLEVSTPVTRGRGSRLRPGRALPTIVRRDILGLRRAPGALIAGLLISAAGAAILGWRLAQPHVPWALVPVGALAAYLGFGPLSGGLRFHGDTAGAPPLLGMPFRSEALAHLVTPLALHAGITLVVLAAVASSGRGQVWRALATALVTTCLVAGAALMAAFRGAPPERAFIPESGPTTMVMWYSRPFVVAVALISATVIVSAPAGPALGAGGAALLAIAGVAAVRRLELAHRI